MKATYRVLAHLIALMVVIQAAGIALGVFGLIHDVDDGKIVDKDYEGNIGFTIHFFGGQLIIPVLAIALLIVSFFAKVPGGVKWALIVFGVVVLQIALAFVSFGVWAVGGLHAINAFVLLGVAEITARRVNGAEAAKPEAPTGAAATA
jgi:hypothetical protein